MYLAKYEKKWKYTTDEFYSADSLDPLYHWDSGNHFISVLKLGNELVVFSEIST
jgi:hypothetical protein